MMVLMIQEVLRGTREAQLQRRAEREAEIEKERKAAQAEAEKRMQKAEGAYVVTLHPPWYSPVGEAWG